MNQNYKNNINFQCDPSEGRRDNSNQKVDKSHFSSIMNHNSNVYYQENMRPECLPALSNSNIILNFPNVQEMCLNYK